LIEFFGDHSHPGAGMPAFRAKLARKRSWIKKPLNLVVEIVARNLSQKLS
jgi:hypothetical protein